MEPGPSNEFDHLWNYDDPATTESRFRELLPTTSDLSLRVQLLTQIARAQGLQRSFDAAHQTLDEAQRLLHPDLTQATIRYLLERGRVFNSAGQPEQAGLLFHQAWEHARAAGEDFYAVDAAHMLGISEPPEQRLVWNLTALDLAEQTTDQRAQQWRGSLYNNIGWTYHEQGRYEQALEYFHKALAWREQSGSISEMLIARWCVARCLRSLGRLTEALAMQQALLNEYEQSGGHDGFVYEELAECLLALDDQAAAQPYFALAYVELRGDPWLADQEPDRLNRLKTFGDVA